MPDDALERILGLVASGRLTAAEAAPIIDALDARPGGPDDRAPGSDRPSSGSHAVRIEVSDSGQTVVNLRVPLALGRAAIGRIPGLSEALAERIREAIETGIKGPIVDVDDDGDGVRITIE